MNKQIVITVANIPSGYAEAVVKKWQEEREERSAKLLEEQLLLVKMRALGVEIRP